jgi:hypothetical protein
LAIPQSGVEDVMGVGHTIAAGLAGILLIQSAAAAQTASGREIRTISRQQGLDILLASLHVGAELRIDLANGRSIEGRLVEKSVDALVVVNGQQRQTVAFSDVVDVRVPMPAGMTGGKAFGIGAAIGAGVILGAIFISAYRH